MRGASIADVALAIVGVAFATTLVAHKYTSSIISAAGGAFSGSIKAATGSGGSFGG